MAIRELDAAEMPRKLGRPAGRGPRPTGLWGRKAREVPLGETKFFELDTQADARAAAGSINQNNKRHGAAYPWQAKYYVNPNDAKKYVVEIVNVDKGKPRPAGRAE